MSAVKKELLRLTSKLPAPVILNDNTRVYKISNILRLYLTPERLASLAPGPIRITIGGDSGGIGSNKCVKIGFFLNNISKNLSTKNFIVLSIKHGGDDYRNIYEIMKVIEDDRKVLCDNGLILNNHRYNFEL